MTLATYLLRTEVRDRWRSLALFGLLVAVVVTAVLTSLAAADRTAGAFDRYADAVRPFDVTVTPDDETTPVPVEELAGLDGVEAAVGFHWYAAFPGDLQTQFFPMVVPDDDRIPLEYLRTPVVSGRRPDPSAPLEVALSERSARRLGVGVGDPLPVATFTDEQLLDGFGGGGGGELTLEVVGIVRAPGDVASREKDLELNLLTPAFADEYGEEVGLFSHGALVRAQSGVPVADITAAIEARHDVEADSFFGTDTIRRQAQPTLDSMAAGLRIVALVIAVVGGTAILLALVRDQGGRVADTAALRALGVTRRGLLAHAALASLLAGLAGIAVGAMASVALVPHVLWGVAERADVDPGIEVHASALLAGIAFATGLLVLALLAVGTLGLRRERAAEAEAGRPSTIASRAAGLGAPLSVVAGLRLAFERGRGQRATPIATAAVAAALGGLGVMATLVFSTSLQHTIDSPDMWGWHMDAVLSRDADGETASRDADPVISEITEDEAFTAVAEYVIDFDLLLSGVPERATVLEDLKGHTPFVLVRGREPLAANEVLVGGTTLEDRGLDLGDAITVQRAHEELQLQIVGVAVLPVNDDGGLSSTGLGMRRDTADLLGFDGTCAEEEPCSRGLAITTAEGVDGEGAAARYVAAGFSYVAPSAPSEVARLSAVDRLPRIVAVVLGIISIVTLAHAAAVTVRRRRRDLAVLRVLGFSGRDLRNTVRMQVAALSLLGGVAGVVLGVAVGRQLWRGVAVSVSVPPVVTMPALTLVLVPVAIAVLAQLGATLPRHAAGRIPAGVVLRTE